MAIVVRRTFFGKVGQGRPLVQLVKEMQSFFHAGGISMKTRVL